MHKLFFICIISLCLFTSCQEDDPLVIEDRPPSKNPFTEYVDRFFEEGSSRGLEYNRAFLSVAYMQENSPLAEQYCGYGYSNYESTGRQRVEINPAPQCWEERDDIEKESFMFHELGHAVLRRAHLNNNLGNGLERSIMCGEPHNCNQFALYNRFMPKLRKYYIDELFDVGAEIPQWALTKPDTIEFFEDAFETLKPRWQFRELFANTPDLFTGQFDSTGTVGALEITSRSNTISRQFGMWEGRFDLPDIEETQTLYLSARVRTENLRGQGAAIALRTDSGVELITSAFSTTQGDLQIVGDEEQVEINLKLGYVPDDVRQLNILFMLLPESIGSAYLEEVELFVLQ